MLEIFKTKRGMDQNISKFKNLLKYDNNKVSVKGSNNYINQKYFSDYDLFSNINVANEKDLFNKIKKIIEKASNDPNVYFIELKFQEKNGDKLKIYKIEDFDSENLKSIKIKNLDFVKIDFVVRIDNNFFELTINYYINPDENSKNNNFIKEMEKGIKELIDEGNYFKALKKVFSINSFYNKENRPIDKKIVNKISKFLNSEQYGKDYQIMGILEANKKLLENYNDSITLKKVEINLKDLGLEPNIKSINKYIKDIYKKINKEAKKVYLDISKK